MKQLLIAGCILFTCTLMSQELNENSFDFWLGDWEISWETTEGQTAKGFNKITRILNDKVIHEDFVDNSIEYNGMSWSMYNQATQKWSQTYVDTDGAHYNFIGIIENGDPVFKTKMMEKDGTQIIYKMIFKNITERRFEWVWCATPDNGLTWNTLWKIDYKKRYL